MIKTNILDRSQIDDISELFNECREYDGLSASITLPSPDEKSEDELFILYYEKKKLISFLSLFSADECFVEIYGLTSPSHRKKGLFSNMVYTAMNETSFLRGRDVLYLSDGKSRDCLLAYNHLGFSQSYSEYIMTAQAPFSTNDAAGDKKITLVPSDNNEKIAKLYHLIFEDSGITAESVLNNIDNNTDSFIFKIDNTDIGIMFLTKQNAGKAYLWNFGLLPEYRGRKLSHQMISALFEYAEGKFNSISLQVSSGNTAAFRLYRKSGFKITSQVSYFSGSVI